jgi:hypothetical protein
MSRLLAHFWSTWCYFCSSPSKLSLLTRPNLDTPPVLSTSDASIPSSITRLCLGLSLSTTLLAPSPRHKHGFHQQNDAVHSHFQYIRHIRCTNRPPLGNDTSTVRVRNFLRLKPASRLNAFTRNTDSTDNGTPPGTRYNRPGGADSTTGDCYYNSPGSTNNNTAWLSYRHNHHLSPSFNFFLHLLIRCRGRVTSRATVTYESIAVY